MKGVGKENVDFNRVNSWNYGGSLGSPAQRKKQRVWDIHCDGGGAVSFFLCGGKAGSDSENASDAGILHRNQPGVSVGTLENGGNHLYCRICFRDLQGRRVRLTGDADRDICEAVHFGGQYADSAGIVGDGEAVFGVGKSERWGREKKIETGESMKKRRDGENG